MREILFKGKKFFDYDDMDGKWVYGHLVVRPEYDAGEDKYFICESGHRYIPCLNKMPCTYKVVPESVCQYTSMKDKNGKRIFEGDVVKYSDFPEPAAVAWDQDDARYYMVFSDCMIDFNGVATFGQVEVIGNIHDNKELLEVEG